MKKRLEINGIIILMGVMLLLSILLKKTQVEIPVTSVSDSEIVFTTEDKILKQTWTPNVKNISEIIIPLTTKNSFEGIIEVSVWTDTCEDKLGAVQVKHIFDEGIAEELRVGFEKPIKVEIGKRHCIQISFVQASSYGEIRIPINSKFTGCSIGDKVQGAAQLTIGSEKNSRICWLVITYMPFVLIAMCFSVIFGRKLEETLGLSFGVVVLWIFLF